MDIEFLFLLLIGYQTSYWISYWILQFYKSSKLKEKVTINMENKEPITNKNQNIKTSKSDESLPNYSDINTNKFHEFMNTVKEVSDKNLPFLPDKKYDYIILDVLDVISSVEDEQMKPVYLDLTQIKYYLDNLFEICDMLLKLRINYKNICQKRYNKITNRPSSPQSFDKKFRKSLNQSCKKFTKENEELKTKLEDYITIFKCQRDNLILSHKNQV